MGNTWAGVGRGGQEGQTRQKGQERQQGVQEPAVAQQFALAVGSSNDRNIMPINVLIAGMELEKVMPSRCS